jgi:hypothetical protein
MDRGELDPGTGDSDTGFRNAAQSRPSRSSPARPNTPLSLVVDIFHSGRDYQTVHHLAPFLKLLRPGCGLAAHDHLATGAPSCPGAGRMRASQARRGPTFQTVRLDRLSEPVQRVALDAARPLLTPPLPTSTRRARRASATATTVASPICTATSSTWPTWSGLPRSAHSIESSTSIRAGNGLPDLRPGAPNGCSAPLSARHPVRLIIVAMNLVLRLQRRPVRAFFRSGHAIADRRRERSRTSRRA